MFANKQLVVKTAGITSILLGLVANEFVLERTLSSDGDLIGSSKLVVWMVDVLLVVLGIFLIKKKEFFAQKLEGVDGKTLLLLFVSILVSFSIIEFGLRFWLKNIASERAFATYATYNMIQGKNLRYERHPYLSFVTTPNYRNDDGDQHNNLGFRGEKIELPKPDGVYRIVAVGGSTTYTSEVKSYDKAYPYLLGEELKNRGFTSVEVINGGVPFYDSWSSLINIAFRVFELDPDLIVYYEGDNEMKTRMVYPYENYKGDNTGRVAPPPVPSVNLINKLVTTRVLLYKLGFIERYSDLSRLHDSPSLVHYEYLNQIQKEEYPSGVFEKENLDILDVLESNPPVHTVRNFKNIIAMSKEQGVDIVFATYAYSPEVGVRSKTEVYARSIEELNKIIQQVAQEERVGYYDFASAMDTDPQYWIRDGVHVNEKGSKLKAGLFADYLETYLKQKGVK